MGICKMSLKLVLKEWRTIAIYIVIFLAMVLLVNRNLNEKEEKVPAVLINEDIASQLIAQFKSYMEQYVEFSENGTMNETQLQEDVFYDQVKVVIRIPRGFTERFFRGRNITIHTNYLIETQESVLVDAVIGKYMIALKQVQSNGTKGETLISDLERMLAKEVPVFCTRKTDKREEVFCTYANYFAYAMLCIIMRYTILLMFCFKKDQIQQHNEIAPINAKAIYRKVIFVSVLVAFVLTILLMLVAGFIARIDFTKISNLVILNNALIFSLYCVSISSIIGILVKSVNRLEIIIQLIALGQTFFCGVFVKQGNLPENITAFTKYIPVYLFVQINNQWSNIDVVKFHDIQEFVIYESTVLCTSMICILITLIIGEKKVEMDL